MVAVPLQVTNQLLAVFDPSNGIIDPDFFEGVQKERYVTSVIISHRVSSVKHADRIIVLDNGKIVESGTHHALLEKHGLYFDLYQKQLLEEENV